MKQLLKKSIVTSLVVAIAVGGAGSALADNDRGQGKDRGKSKGKEVRQYVETKLETKKATQKIEINNYGTINITFNDIVGGDVEWAERYIASLASKKVFQGYEDGTFKPRQTISRVEAITAAVRLMGLEEEAKSEAAMKAELNFKDAEKLEDKYGWAVGYVSVALANDLFTETDDRIQPDAPADRLWATTLLVKAMKLQNEAKAKMNTKLSFKDADKIPAGSVGYVAVALERGLIEGYENNTFRPEKPVTRAEMAALLDRTGNQLPDYAAVRGSVTQAVYSNVLALNVQGTATNIVLDEKAFVFRNGTQVSASAIQVGDEVLVRTYGGKAIYVEVTKLSTEPVHNNFSVIGALNTFTLNNQGAIATVSIDHVVNGALQTTVYNVSGELTIEGSLSGLIKGAPIELKGQNQIVNTIVVR